MDRTSLLRNSGSESPNGIIPMNVDIVQDADFGPEFKMNNETQRNYIITMCLGLSMLCMHKFKAKWKWLILYIYMSFALFCFGVNYYYVLNEDRPRVATFSIEATSNAWYAFGFGFMIVMSIVFESEDFVRISQGFDYIWVYLYLIMNLPFLIYMFYYKSSRSFQDSWANDITYISMIVKNIMMISSCAVCSIDLENVKQKSDILLDHNISSDKIRRVYEITIMRFRTPAILLLTISLAFTIMNLYIHMINLKYYRESSSTEDIIYSMCKVAVPMLCFTILLRTCLKMSETTVMLYDKLKRIPERSPDQITITRTLKSRAMITKFTKNIRILSDVVSSLIIISTIFSAVR